MGRFLRLSGGVMRSYDEASGTTIYNQSVTIGSTITTGTPQTLPASQTYDSAELEVRLNGIKLEPVADYNYVGGSPPRTQVTFTFDLVAGDVITYRLDRAA